MTNAAIVPDSNRGVLVASPSSSVREQVRRSLQGSSRALQEVSGGADALAQLESGDWQLLYLDRRLPDLDAEELIQIIKARFPGIEIVMVDADAVPPPRPWPASAPDSRSWPLPLPRPAAFCLPLQTVNASPDIPAKRETPASSLPGMIGSGVKMQRVYRLARLVAPRFTTVLVVGATGTGKELVARALHDLSPRRAGPWVVVNCAAIPETLLESELFGYTRGAFSGAVQAYGGRIAAAQGGTLFLDEVGELPLGLQAKLLRFLEQREVQRLGSAETVKVDVRVVAATNADLEHQVGAGQFRPDLYYRLAAFPLALPTLAERREDIVPLAEHFLRIAADTPANPPPRLSSEACRRLLEQAWKGNVRELQQVMERAVILAEGDTILPQHLYFATALWAQPVHEPPVRNSA